MTQTLDTNKPININFNPSKKQTKAWELLNDKDTLFVGYGGAAFSGKTHLLCNWITIMCIAYPETSWGLGRKELVTLKKTTLITLFKIFDEYNIVSERDYKYNQQLNNIEFYNKSVIYLIDTASKPSDPLFTRFGGLELTGCGIDESAETEYKAIEILFTRLGRRNNDKYGIQKKMLETFNPSKTHIYRRYYLPHKSGNELVHTKFIPALPSDNPSPEVPEYIKGIVQTSDEVTIQRLIHGNFEYDDDPTVIIEFDAITDYLDATHVQRTGQKFMTVDVARLGSDSSVIRVWDGWLCIERLSFNKIGLNELSKEMKMVQTRHGIPISNIIADEDGVGSGIVDFFKCKGFVNNSRPLEMITPDGEKIIPNYENLKTQCSVLMALKIQNREVGEINLTGDVKDRISEEMQQIKYIDADKDGKIKIQRKDDIKKNIGRSPDDWDCIMMRYYFELEPKKAEVFLF